MLETKQIDGEDALNICRELTNTHGQARGVAVKIL